MHDSHEGIHPNNKTRAASLACVLPNQSLKLTAEAQVETRDAQENELVLAARRQCGTVVRIVR